jgi:hypothetical protein
LPIEAHSRYAVHHLYQVGSIQGILMPQAIGSIAARLQSLNELRSIPFGMKLFERRADMEAVPRSLNRVSSMIVDVWRTP